MTITVNGIDLETDAEGFLVHHEDWNIEVANAIAQNQGLELTPERLEVVMFVRNFYDKYNTSPAIRALVKAMANEFGPDKGNSRYLYKLFPEGPAMQAARIAGLPRPVRCI